MYNLRNFYIFQTEHPLSPSLDRILQENINTDVSLKEMFNLLQRSRHSADQLGGI